MNVMNTQKTYMQASLTPKSRTPSNTGVGVTWHLLFSTSRLFPFSFGMGELRYQTPEDNPFQKEPIRELCCQLCLWKCLLNVESFPGLII